MRQGGICDKRRGYISQHSVARVTNIAHAHLYVRRDKQAHERKHCLMSKLLRIRRLTILASSLVTAFVLALATASAASAFSESYGFYQVGNGGYVQSAGAHTFIYNDGAAAVGGTLACQLFNHEGVNEVEHGSGGCTVLYGGGAFVWARVYNEAGFQQEIGGEAGT